MTDKQSLVELTFLLFNSVRFAALIITVLPFAPIGRSIGAVYFGRVSFCPGLGRLHPRPGSSAVPVCKGSWFGGTASLGGCRHRWLDYFHAANAGVLPTLYGFFEGRSAKAREFEEERIEVAS